VLAGFYTEMSEFCNSVQADCCAELANVHKIDYCVQN